VTIATFSMPSPSGPEDMVEAKLQQCSFVRICRQVHVAAVAAVPSARPASRNKLFPAKGDGAMASITGFHGYCGFVDKHEKGRRNPEPAAALASSDGIGGGLLLYRLDADETSDTAFIGELHNAGDLGEERVVFSNAHIVTGFELCSALAHQNRSARYELTCKPLHAETLGVAVTAVTRTSNSFFMGHRLNSLDKYLFDSNCSEILPVTPGTAILLLPLFLEHNDFLAAVLLENRGFNVGILD
jgi:hypothetical protein